jgi:hypothetical protein
MIPYELVSSGFIVFVPSAGSAMNYSYSVHGRKTKRRAVECSGCRVVL